MKNILFSFFMITYVNQGSFRLRRNSRMNHALLKWGLYNMLCWPHQFNFNWVCCVLRLRFNNRKPLDHSYETLWKTKTGWNAASLKPKISKQFTRQLNDRDLFPPPRVQSSIQYKLSLLFTLESQLVSQILGH